MYPCRWLTARLGTGCSQRAMSEVRPHWQAPDLDKRLMGTEGPGGFHRPDVEGWPMML